MKLLLPLIEIVAALVAMHRWTKRRNENFALSAPASLQLLFWLALYAVWMLGTNFIWHWRGPWDFTPWKQASLLHDAGRLLAVGVLGPIGEELIFRGFFYRVIERTRAGWPGAIVLTAAVWAGVHYQYTWPIILLLFADGLLLGLARHYSKSVWTPAAMHILWNLFAVW